MILAMILAACVQVPTITSAPDAEGRRTVRFDLPTEARPFRITPTPISVIYCSPLPGGYRITKVRTFVGFDAGTRAETALDLVVGGFELANRSEHKETLGIYDSWREADTSYLMPLGPNWVYFIVRGWTTDGRVYGMEPGLVVEISPVSLAVRSTK